MNLFSSIGVALVRGIESELVQTQGEIKCTKLL